MSKVDLKVDWCSHEAAKYAVQNWHYSRSLPTPPLVKIGVWENSKYIGCVLFSRGASDALGDPYGLKSTEICELSRVALANHQTPVSKIIAVAIKLLKRENQKLRLIISFADANQAHLGVIYQAGNWLYTGQTNKDFKYKDLKGRIWHSRQVSNSGLKKQYGVYRSAPKKDDCEKIELLPKYRYLMPLDEAMRNQIKSLAKPYPKRVVSIENDASDIQSEEGGANPTATLQPSNE
jgi:hypothetical protein